MTHTTVTNNNKKETMAKTFSCEDGPEGSKDPKKFFLKGLKSFKGTKDLKERKGSF